MGEMSACHVLVTGAAGYLGQKVVSVAAGRGHKVVAVVRPGTDLSGMPWFRHANVRVRELDLSLESASENLTGLLKEDLGNLVVVHTAGALKGDDDHHARQTIAPVRRLLDAMQKANRRRLVHMSSMSVYGYGALPEGGQLDETTPLEPYEDQRDAYCRAKIAQEKLLLEAAQCHGLRVTVLRAGVIFGPGRYWTSRLGVARGKLGVQIGSRARIPWVQVDHCAEAVVLAVEHAPAGSDVFVRHDQEGRDGALEVVNVIDDAQPTQNEYIKTMRTLSDAFPKFLLPVPWGAARTLAKILEWVDMICPTGISRLPGSIRPASIYARFKPVRYSNCRLYDRLGWVPGNAREHARDS